MVPVLGVIRAGCPALAEEHITGYVGAEVSDPEACFYLRVSGDSMINAGIRSGDLVLIRRQCTAENGQIVACMVDGEDATLKRFRRQGDMVILQPENPDYEPRLISLGEFERGAARILGVAVKLTREL
jgi:repressor LexA